MSVNLKFTQRKQNPTKSLKVNILKSQLFCLPFENSYVFFLIAKPYL